MSIVRSVRIVFGVLGLVLAVPGLAAPLKIYGVEEPPANYADSKGRATGLVVDVVREIQRRVGNKDPIEIIPETKALDIARSTRNVVLFSFSRTAERESQYIWITQVIRKPWVFYALKDTNLQAASLDDMRKVTAIGVVDGDVRAKYLQKEGFTNLQVAAEPEENLANLLAGKVQAVFSEPAGIAFFCRKLDCTKNPVEPVFTPRSSDVYILMSKGSDPAVVSAWQKAAAAMKSDGTFDQIAKRWIVKAAMDFGVESFEKDGAVNYR